MPPPPRSPRITAQDVAAKAGVSQPTVSLVLSGNPKARVASETRERIYRAAEELGYRPNLLAQGLVRRRSYALGVIVPDLSNPFFAAIVSGAEKVAAKEGYAVFLCESGETTAAQHVAALRARQIDGVIVDAVGASELTRKALQGINVVLVDDASDELTGILSDAEEAGRLAADHLLTLGHRQIAVIAPAVDVRAFRMRERGFVIALRKAGVRIPTEFLRRAPATVGGGRSAMRALLALRPAPTAVFCANDLVAIGAMKACANGRVNVPVEVSIVGCDDVDLAQLVTPELTTVAVPARELGARAARALLRQIDGEAAGRPSKPLAVKLVVRGTTARVPGSA